MKIQQCTETIGSNLAVHYSVNCETHEDIASALSFVVELRLQGNASRASALSLSDKIKTKTSTIYCFGYCDRITKIKTMYTVVINYPQEDNSNDSKSVKEIGNHGKRSSK